MKLFLNKSKMDRNPFPSEVEQKKKCIKETQCVLMWVNCCVMCLSCSIFIITDNERQASHENVLG